MILFDSDCARAHLATSRRNVFLEREREREIWGNFRVSHATLSSAIEYPFARKYVH